MSKKPNSNRTYQSNIAFLFCSLSLAALLAATQDRAINPSTNVLATDIVPRSVTLVENVSPWSVEPELPRDPCINPIIGCTFIAPQDFGYDRREIYRLPQEPRPEWKGSSNGLRDPWQLQYD